MLSLKVEHLCDHKYEMDHKFPHDNFESHKLQKEVVFVLWYILLTIHVFMGVNQHFTW